MKKIIFTVAVLLFLFIASAKSQVSITGPTCVVAGTMYQYLISGKWDSTSMMKICLTGGNISAKAISCTPSGKPVSFIQVEWQKGTGGTIQVSSSSGDTSLSVAITLPLSGGSILDSFKRSAIAFNNAPGIIRCSPSTGGSCLPKYTYQWQQSPNVVNWTDIKGANSLDLLPPASFKQTSYFRRKVTETVSGTIAYSDFASVDVGPSPPTTSSTSSGSGDNNLQ